MTAKVTKVVLECPTLNTTEEFEINHAERLLRMPNNGGWQLPEKTPFEFSKENGINIKRIRKEITEPRKKATINKAVIHQNRIKFHAQTNVTPLMCLPTTDFLAWVQNLIPHDKFKIFKTLFRYPVRTNEAFN